MFKPFSKLLDGEGLRACPHCGGECVLRDSAEMESNVFGPPAAAVHCTRCRAYGHTVCYDWTEHNFFGFETIKPTRLEARTIAAALWNVRSPKEYQRTIEAIAEMLHRNRCFDAPGPHTVDGLDNTGIAHTKRGSLQENDPEEAARIDAVFERTRRKHANG